MNFLDAIFDATRESFLIEDRQQCEEELSEFVKGAWPIIDPGEPLIWGWPMDAVCDHVQAVYDGYIKRLLITVPPGFSKSTITSVMYPAWCWTKKPQMRFICASYTENLTTRDNDRTRNILTSEWYQARWGDKFALAPPNMRGHFANDKMGWKKATSVGGELIGWRANCIILDDPNKPKGEKSEERVSTGIWFREVVPSRLNNPKRDAIILIQQRLHLEDCAGIALGMEKTPWVHLNIPMEYEPRAYVNGFAENSDEMQTLFDEDAKSCPEPFWYDPRERDGELAWPARFPSDWVEQHKDEIGPTMVAAQLQQHPVPRGGAIIKSDWWQEWDESLPPRYPFSYFIASIDTAYTEDKQNDPSACTIWGLCHDEYGNPQIHLLDAWQEWLMLHELVERIIDTCQRDDRTDVVGKRYPVDKVLIENAASGKSVAQEIERILRQRASFGIELIDPRSFGGDKVARLQSVEHIFARKTVYAPVTRDWADKVITQCATIPYTSDDHLADTVAMAVRWLRDCGYAPTKEEAAEQYLDERKYKPRNAGLGIAKGYFD